MLRLGSLVEWQREGCFVVSERIYSGHPALHPFGVVLRFIAFYSTICVAGDILSRAGRALTRLTQLYNTLTNAIFRFDELLDSVTTHLSDDNDLIAV